MEHAMARTYDAGGDFENFETSWPIHRNFAPNASPSTVVYPIPNDAKQVQGLVIQSLVFYRTIHFTARFGPCTFQLVDQHATLLLGKLCWEPCLRNWKISIFK